MLSLADLLHRRGVRGRAASRSKTTRQHSPSGEQLAYASWLHGVHDALADQVWSTLAEHGVVPRRDDRAVLPASRDRILAKLRDRFAQIAGNLAIASKLDQLAASIGTQTRVQWLRQVQRAIGIDTSKISLGEIPLERLIREWRRANVSLIRDLATDQYRRVAKILEQPLTRDERVASLQDAVGVTRRRATLIAQDQTTKLAADITQARHEAAGIREFVWSTSRDARVRPEHRALEGKRFRYDDPPVIDGDPSLPGQQVRCRCVGIPVIPTN